jgi:hypothetical protein
MSFAQENYVVTVQGDTLEGKISFSFGNPAFDKVFVKMDQGTQEFRSYQVSQIIFKSDTVDVVKLGSEIRFGKRLSKGKSLSLYQIQRNSNFEFDTEILLKPDETYLEIPNIGFRKFVSMFIEDCEEVASKVQSGDYKSSEVIQIVEDYNQICGAEGPTLSKAQSPKKVLIDSDSLQIVKLIEEDYKTLESFDFEKHASNVTTNYRLVEDGKVLTLKDEQDYYQKNKDKEVTRDNLFEIESIKIDGDLAYAFYTLKSYITIDGTLSQKSWIESVVFRRVNGYWKIELIHSTEIE